MTYYTTPSLVLGASFGRSFNAILPNHWRPDRSYPLCLMLHSYGATGADIHTRVLYGVSPQMDDGCIVLAPTATNTDGGANLYWKYWATGGTDDFDFLSSVVAEARARFSVSSVWGIGYSNGGFMTIQMSLQYPTLYDAMVTIACAGGTNDSTATAVKAIARWHLHGDADTLVLPGGDVAAATLPGSLAGHGGIGSTGYVDTATTVAQAAARNGNVSALGAPGAAFDLWTTGTPTGTGAESAEESYTGTPNVSRVLATAATHGLTVSSVSATSKGGTRIFSWLRSAAP